MGGVLGAATGFVYLLAVLGGWPGVFQAALALGLTTAVAVAAWESRNGNEWFEVGISSLMYFGFTFLLSLPLLRWWAGWSFDQLSATLPETAAQGLALSAFVALGFLVGVVGSFLRKSKWKWSLVGGVFCVWGLVLLVPILLGVVAPDPAAGPGTRVDASTAETEEDTSFSGTEEEERQLNLDRGAWRQIQRSLVEKGHLEPGQVDGIPGRRTRQAVGNWQQDASTGPPTGYLTSAAVRALLGPEGRLAASPEEGVPATQSAEEARRPEENVPAAQPEEDASAAPSAERDFALRIGRAAAAQPTEDDAEGQLAALSKQAREGDARAQIDVALMYLEGRGGIDRNYADAMRWLQAARTNGQSEAAMHLALMYAAGEGVPSNRDQALDLFREFTDAHELDSAPSASEQYEALAAEIEGAYSQLSQEYLWRIVILEMEPTGIVRWRYTGSDPRAIFRRAGREVGDILRSKARDIRDQGRRHNWSLPASAHPVLDKGATAQHQRGPDTMQRDIAGYLVDQMRGIVRREQETLHNNMYQPALRAIESEEQRLGNIIDNMEAYAGAIKIDARPKDATVSIDGVGYGTVDDMDDEQGRAVLAGPRTIRISRDGYQTHEEIKDLRPRERYVISGSLERLRSVGHNRDQQEND